MGKSLLEADRAKYALEPEQLRTELNIVGNVS